MEEKGWRISAENRREGGAEVSRGWKRRVREVSQRIEGKERRSLAEEAGKGRSLTRIEGNSRVSLPKDIKEGMRKLDRENRKGKLDR